jgi:hypothetical protein
MTVSTGAEETLAQKLRLEKLGYSILDVIPPLSPTAPAVAKAS